MIGYLLNSKSIHVFHKPKDVGALKEYCFLAAINGTTKYAVGLSDSACLSISSESMGYVKDVLKTAQNNFSKIADIGFGAVAEVHGYIDETNNKLTHSCEIVKKLLPTKKIDYETFNCLPQHDDEYFVDLAALSRLWIIQLILL